VQANTECKLEGNALAEVIADCLVTAGVACGPWWDKWVLLALILAHYGISRSAWWKRISAELGRFLGSSRGRISYLFIHLHTDHTTTTTHTTILSLFYEYVSHGL